MSLVARRVREGECIKRNNFGAIVASRSIVHCSRKRKTEEGLSPRVVRLSRCIDDYTEATAIHILKGRGKHVCCCCPLGRKRRLGLTDDSIVGEVPVELAVSILRAIAG